MIKESKEQLEKYGIVYTLRPKKRKIIGKSWYNYFRNDIKRGDVYIEFIGDFSYRSSQLEPYVKDSGFNSLKEWLKKAKKNRHLYKVRLLKRWS